MHEGYISASSELSVLTEKKGSVGSKQSHKTIVKSTTLSGILFTSIIKHVELLIVVNYQLFYNHSPIYGLILSSSSSS